MPLILEAFYRCIQRAGQWAKRLLGMYSISNWMTHCAVSPCHAYIS